MNVTVPVDSMSIAVRELANGVWSVSSFFLLSVIGIYVWRASNRRNWSKDPGSRFAIALFILVLGHLLRSLGVWISIILATAPPALVFPSLDGHAIVNTWEYLVAATAMIVTGKALCICILTSVETRFVWITAFVVASIVIPAAVMIFL